MSYTNLSLPFDNEKLKAMQFALAAKALDANAEIQAAMSAAVQRIFDERVPKQVREYINFMSQSEQELTLFSQQPQQLARRKTKEKEQTPPPREPSASEIVKGQVEFGGVKNQGQTTGQQPDKAKQEQEHVGR